MLALLHGMHAQMASNIATMQSMLEYIIAFLNISLTLLLLLDPPGNNIAK